MIVCSANAYKVVTFMQKTNITQQDLSKCSTLTTVKKKKTEIEIKLTLEEMISTTEEGSEGEGHLIVIQQVVQFKHIIARLRRSKTAPAQKLIAQQPCGVRICNKS